MNYRNKRLLALAKKATHCMMCFKSNDGTIVSAHSNQLRDGKGKGIKAHDYRIAFLCYTCHFEIDQGNKMSKVEKMEEWEKAHRATIGFLFENDLIKVI